MQRIVILNPKGGSGKTTIATNLAAYYAARGDRPALLDLDPQASSTRWLSKRCASSNAPIYGIAGFERCASVTRTWQMRVPVGCWPLIVDTPAALESRCMPEIIRGAAAVLVPVMPSDIDIQATAKCIADLLLVAKIRRAEGRLGIIANRVRTNTRVSLSLARFLDSLDIPLVATFKDSQSYVRSAEAGIGLAEMPHRQIEHELTAWDGLAAWLAERPLLGHRARMLGAAAITQAVAGSATTAAGEKAFEPVPELVPEAARETTRDATRETAPRSTIESAIESAG